MKNNIETYAVGKKLNICYNYKAMLLIAWYDNKISLLQIQDKLFQHYIIAISSNNKCEESFNSKGRVLGVSYIQKCITCKDVKIVRTLWKKTKQNKKHRDTGNYFKAIVYFYC